jgi:hypothetical protein
MPLLFRITCWLLLPAILQGATPLQNAQRAQTLLGADTWSRIITVENRSEQSVYPATVVALVFELSGILWFYTDVNGTQSFSLHRNNLKAEKADFSPLLRDIEPGFASYTVLPHQRVEAKATWTEPLPNGCLIESVAAAKSLIVQGAEVSSPTLLWFYYDYQGSRKGHTVLTYENETGAYLLDPGEAPRHLRVGSKLPEDPALLARIWEQDRSPVLKVRSLTIALPDAVTIATVDANCERASA